MTNRHTNKNNSVLSRQHELVSSESTNNTNITMPLFLFLFICNIGFYVNQLTAIIDFCRLKEFFDFIVI